MVMVLSSSVCHLDGYPAIYVAWFHVPGSNLDKRGNVNDNVKG